LQLLRLGDSNGSSGSSTAAVFQLDLLPLLRLLLLRLLQAELLQLLRQCGVVVTCSTTAASRIAVAVTPPEIHHAQCQSTPPTGLHVHLA
jgi:hypothetical protein